MMMNTNRKRLKQEMAEPFDIIIRGHLEAMRPHMTNHCDLISERTLSGIVALEPKNQNTLDKLKRALSCIFRRNNYPIDLYNLLEGEPENIEKLFEPVKIWKEDGRLYKEYSEELRQLFIKKDTLGLNIAPYSSEELNREDLHRIKACINSALPFFANVAMDWSKDLLSNNEAEVLLGPALSSYQDCHLFRKRANQIGIVRETILSLLGPHGNKN